MNSKNNNNKFEITITSTKSNLDAKKLELYFIDRERSNIKKIKVLPDRNKAFITFNDSKSYDRAITMMHYSFKALPTNISMSDIFQQQNNMKKRIVSVAELTEDLNDELTDFVEYRFKKLEKKLVRELEDNLFVLSDVIKSSVNGFESQVLEIATKVRELELEVKSLMKSSDEDSISEKSSSEQET